MAKPYRFLSEGTQQLLEAVLAEGTFDIPDFPTFSRSVSAADRVASSGFAGAPEQSRTVPGGWRLACLDHKVHCDAEFCQGPQQTPARRRCEHYTVSNLRPFSVQVELQDSHGRPVRDHPPIMLSAKVIYDNGEAVSLRANENQFDESFPAECLLISGGATFNLRLGQQVLTDKHLRRLFRIHIQPKEMQYADLWVQTVPMRSVVKLPCMRKDRKASDEPMPPALALTSGAGPSSFPTDFDLGALKTQLKRELYAELKADLKKEVRAELKKEVKADLKQEVQAELRDELMAEIPHRLEIALSQRGNTGGGGLAAYPLAAHGKTGGGALAPPSGRPFPREVIDQDTVIQQLQEAILETQGQISSAGRNGRAGLERIASGNGALERNGLGLAPERSHSGNGVGLERNNSGIGALERNGPGIGSGRGLDRSTRMLPPSRHASDKNSPQEEKRRRG